MVYIDLKFMPCCLLFGQEDNKVTLESRGKVKKLGCSYVLYDDQLISEPNLQLFDADYLTNSDSCTNSTLSAGAGIGRARVVYFIHHNITMVLKHYYRGGAISALVKDRYLGFNIENTRSFREWYLLKKMRSFDLPVPNAVAARVSKGVFFYQADLITQELENTKTLSDILSEGRVNSEQWKSIGACIKLFHQNNIYHADLNARNILLDQEGEVYLIDFDNSFIRTGGSSWKMSNLIRLKRSLNKFKRNESTFYFEELDWSNLVQGYQ
jgi:3-deoxy-D-manno-octulosonic acid kinase